MPETEAAHVLQHLDSELATSWADAVAALLPVRLAVFDTDGNRRWTANSNQGRTEVPQNIFDAYEFENSGVVAGEFEKLACGEGLIGKAKSAPGECVLTVPLCLEKSSVGTVAAFLDQDRVLPELLQQTYSCLNAAAMSLSSILLERQTTDKVVDELSFCYEELSLIHELGGKLISSIDIDRSLPELLRLVCTVLPADLGVITFPDFGIDVMFPEHLKPSFNWKIALKEMQKRSTGPLADIQVDLYGSTGPPRVVDRSYSHAALFSFQADGKPGQMGFFVKGSKRAFTMADIKLCDATTRILAVVLANYSAVISRRKAYDSAIFALAQLAESRDPETGRHLNRVSEFARLIAMALVEAGIYSEDMYDGFIPDLVRSTPLHDIGKVSVPDSILLKPGKLTPEEFDVMKTHSTVGGDTLRMVIEGSDMSGVGFLSLGMEIAYTHHEKWDGSGYPRGLKELEIPLSGRIVALADVYDALTSSRCYKAAFSHERARGIIVEGRGTHFDPHVVDAFLAKESLFESTRGELAD